MLLCSINVCKYWLTSWTHWEHGNFKTSVCSRRRRLQSHFYTTVQCCMKCPQTVHSLSRLLVTSEHRWQSGSLAIQNRMTRSQPNHRRAKSIRKWAQRHSDNPSSVSTPEIGRNLAGNSWLTWSPTRETFAGNNVILLDTSSVLAVWNFNLTFNSCCHHTCCTVSQPDAR